MTTPTAVKPVAGTACPHCGASLVSERQATPWCSFCGWNIDCYEPDRRQRELRWKWADKISFEAAYDLNERQFAALLGRPVDKPGWSGAKALILLCSLVAIAFVAGLVALGAWLISIGTLPAYVLAAAVVGLAVLLRPRLGKLGKYAEPVDLTDLPALHRLVTRVAEEIGAPVPQVALFTTAFTAGSGSYGLRRRRVLSIGLPLWLSLTPQEQVALIGHELGHFVNGDVRRGWLSSYAFTVVGLLAHITRPNEGPSPYGRYAGRSTGAGLANLGELIARPILGVVSAILSLIQLGLLWLGVRATHHSEYAADAMAARVAGSGPAAGLIDTLMLREVCVMMLRKSLRADPAPAAWRAAAGAGRQDVAPRVLRLRQLSMRDSAVLGHTHPPAGLRARLIESRTPQSASIVLTEAEAAQIDQEMLGRYRTYRTVVLNS